MSDVVSMSEGEVRQYMMERVKEISDAHVRLVEKVDKIKDEVQHTLNAFKGDVQKALDDFDENFGKKINGLDCREHNRRLSQIETTIEITQDRISEEHRRRKTWSGILIAIWTAIIGAILAVAKYITDKK